MKKTKQRPNAVSMIEEMLTKAERERAPLWAEYQRQVARLLWQIVTPTLGEEGNE